MILMIIQIITTTTTTTTTATATATTTGAYFANAGVSCAGGLVLKLAARRVEQAAVGAAEDVSAS